MKKKVFRERYAAEEAVKEIWDKKLEEEVEAITKEAETKPKKRGRKSVKSDK